MNCPVFHAAGNSCAAGANHGASQFMPIRAIHDGHASTTSEKPSLSRVPIGMLPCGVCGYMPYLIFILCSLSPTGLAKIHKNATFDTAYKAVCGSAAPPCALGYFTYTINDITLFARLLFFSLLDSRQSLDFVSSRVFFFHYVNEPYAFRLVENKGVEPLTPSLQS